MKIRKMLAGVYKPKAIVSALAALMLAATGGVVAKEAPEEIKMGVTVFLSGPAAGPFGLPSKNAAELIIDAINKGELPAPYNSEGLAGVPIKPIIVDEAGGTANVVSNLRNVVQKQGADVLVGYISSGSCLAAAPVVEELKTLTVFHTCGTPRLFEDNDYKYSFRTASHATMDNVAAAMYVSEKRPNIKKYAGINQNYAWGQDSWRDFELVMKNQQPKAEPVTALFPKIFAGQYSSEISTLMVKKPEVVHSSFWDGDLESFIFQSLARGLPRRSQLLLTTGETAMYSLADKIPNGTIIGARGPYGVFAKTTPLNTWFRDAYKKRFGTEPIYPSYHMAQGILGLKVAYDKAAQQSGSGFPTDDQVAGAFEHLEFEAFGTQVNMARGKGHQAVTDTAYGMYEYDKSAKAGKVVDVAHYAADCVNPPEGVKSVDWIKAGLSAANCQ